MTREWDALAGEWDDLAAGYATGFYRELLRVLRDEQQRQQQPHRTTSPRGGGSGAAGAVAEEESIPRRRTTASTTTPRLDETTRAAVVVDFGCGTGLLTAKLSAAPWCAKVLALDASGAMVRAVHDKMRARDWHGVQAVTAVLGLLEEEAEGGGGGGGDDEEMPLPPRTAQPNTVGDYETAAPPAAVDAAPSVSTTNAVADAAAARAVLAAWRGSADVVAASSVLNFVPPGDLPATMRQLARLLKPHGLLVHTDWPAKLPVPVALVPGGGNGPAHPAHHRSVGGGHSNTNSHHNTNGMDEARACAMYAMGGFTAVSMRVVRLDAAGGATATTPGGGTEVFVGVARKGA